MFRFFVDQKENNSFILDENTLKHIKVARVTNKEFICVYQEKFYICKLEGSLAIIQQELKENHEFNGEVIIGAAIIDIKRFEWMIQKATELGVTKIFPIYTQNVSRKISGDVTKKVARWNQIAKNASEQSFRNKALIVTKPIDFKEVLNTNIKNKYLAHEKQDSSVDLSFPTDSLFLVGPEGGFTDEEVELALKNDFKVISLGKRILRAETASIFIASRIN